MCDDGGDDEKDEDGDQDCLWGILSISIKVMGGIDPEPGATKSLSGITAKASKTQKEVPDLNWSRKDSSFTTKKKNTSRPARMHSRYNEICLKN